MAGNHKFESNKKYFTICIYTIAVILIGCIIFQFVTQWDVTKSLITELWDILFPFFLGFLIAYIINPVVGFFQRNLFSKIIPDTHKRLCRGISILFSYLLFLGGLAVCLIFVIPQLIESIQELSLQIPGIYNTLTDLSDRYLKSSTSILPSEVIETIETKTLPKLMSLTNDLISNLIPWIYNITVSLAKWMFNLIIALVTSIYMTADKKIIIKFLKRFVLAIFSEKTSYSVLRKCKDCHKIFSSFIIGKSIDSLIIGILCFLLMTLLHLPYAVLISVIVGITNMIPYFGPFIGAVPGAFILFIVSPMKALIFIIMVFLLQQFDGFILGPKILGESTGVRPLLILFSITVGGAYFGPLGMFLGVPFFACVQYLIENWVDYRLYKKKITLSEKDL
ncbi:MAG TPA: AI-2E family transporter [Candidatus Anaerostipes excrementavium]|uniref:AI-2E family transporter n=1 Tax=Candidatus Anaerostipes excrementavium TaxID=2838463 RepID=A0A9D2B9C4_9FIRM|nr:AI-2E family transporter [uncultured Anaerostipes sp.]HIX67723.1 AI-2E family transporter [Candidatus Anaerostipes excrementavium]